MKYAYFNFRKWNNEKVLLTNDLGRWAFVSPSTFQAILLNISTNFSKKLVQK